MILTSLIYVFYIRKLLRFKYETRGNNHQGCWKPHIKVEFLCGSFEGEEEKRIMYMNI